MKKMLDNVMTQAAKALRGWPSRSVRLFHHNDADGLSSAAILSLALVRADFDVARVCLEKPYPPVLTKIFQERGAVLIFADFAGQIAPSLAALNAGRNLVLILDHHPALPVADPGVHHLNPDLFGFRGDRDASASTTCFRFAQILDPANRDLAYLAVTGAVGDGFYVDGRLAGMNREALASSMEQGQIIVRPRTGGEDYDLQMNAHGGPVKHLAADLDVMGGMGFFQGGPEAAIRVCLKGFDDDARRLRTHLAARREALYRAEVERLQTGGLKVTGRVQWFSVAERFEGIGVKMIGDFCRFIRQREFIDPDGYIAGFQPVPDRVPGLGPIRFDAVKVSMRVPPQLEGRIRDGHMPGLDRLLPEATQAVGGFADACHSLAAATTVPPGSEARLVAALSRMIPVEPERSG
ncbi:MAG: hypothetical protein QNJ04_11510 [Desulfobacterales bacterium]|nr:hypothetical protein [Desulfobacterales bacterium]